MWQKTSILTIVSILHVFSYSQEIQANQGDAALYQQLRLKREELQTQMFIDGPTSAITKRLSKLEQELLVLCKPQKGQMYGQALYELAEVQRLQGHFDAAMETYNLLTQIVPTKPLVTTLFRTWLNLTYLHLTLNHPFSEAEAAYHQAEQYIPNMSERKRKFLLARNGAFLNIERGEYGLALMNVLEAEILATQPKEKLTLYTEIVDLYDHILKRCRHGRFLEHGALPSERDFWKTCLYAADIAIRYAKKGAEVAQTNGWRFLKEDRLEAHNNQLVRKHTLEQRMRIRSQSKVHSSLGEFEVNHDYIEPKKIKDVCTNPSVEWESMCDYIYSFLQNPAQQLGLEKNIEELSAEALYVLSLVNQNGGKYKQAAFFLQKAAAQLQSQRIRSADIFQQGAAIEQEYLILEDWAAHQLHMKQFSGAYEIFESMRAVGMNRIHASFTHQMWSSSERKHLAQYYHIISEITEVLSQFMEAKFSEKRGLSRFIDQYQRLKHQKSNLETMTAHKKIVEKLALSKPKSSFRDLNIAVQKSGVTVLFYWVRESSTLIWHIGKAKPDVQVVHISKSELNDKIRELNISLQHGATQDFNKKLASELYSILLTPFEKHLNGSHLLIIPHQRLWGLPFEALIHPSSGRYLVQDVDVSYSINGYFAQRTLNTPRKEVKKITAIFDEDLENVHSEINSIGRTSFAIDENAVQGLTSAHVLNKIHQKDALHILLHGFFNQRAPMLSGVRLNPLAKRKKGKERSRNSMILTAAQLLEPDWTQTHLVVMSACQSMNLSSRLSSEISGMAWPMIAGGVQTFLGARWDVNAERNAEWMVGFYQELSRIRHSPAVAASRLMRKMISKRYHPYYWAGVQVVGR